MTGRFLLKCAFGLVLALPLMAQTPRLQWAMAQQLSAAPEQGNTQILGMRLSPDGDRLKLEIETQEGRRPQVFFTQQGSSWIGDITNAELQIAPGQQSFRQDNPVPGIARIEVQQNGPDSVRMQLTGSNGAPQGLLSERTPSKLTFAFTTPGMATAQAPAAPAVSQPPAAPVSPTAQAPAASPVSQPPAAPVSPTAQDPAAPSPTAQIPSQPVQPTVAQAPVSQVPDVGQLGQPAGSDPNGSPFANQAIAPPTGDIAIGTIIPQAATVDLGSNATITLTLRDAPVADVVSLLVRRAGLNVVLNDVDPTDTISLDVQDAPLQETFNFILRLKRLQARRVDQSVFVGITLPGVQERIAKTFRLNQITLAPDDFFSTAEAAAGDGIGGSAVGIESVLPSGERLLESLDEQVQNESSPIFGATILADVRTNTITVIGTPQQVEFVGAYLAQIDTRARQALISVRLVDVQLTDNTSIGTQIGSASGNFGFNSGSNTDSFGGTPLDQPQGSSVSTIGIDGGVASGGGLVFNSLNRLQQSVAARIEASIEQDSGKVLADPKIVVSDGGSSALAIGQEVFAGFEEIQTTEGQSTRTTRQPIIKNAGVSLSISNVRIDDNGFITLDIQPSVTAPSGTAITTDGEITLLSQRNFGTSQIRFRDGETFVLSGLIQDVDRVTVERVPLLSEVPILGALFRRQSTQNERSEIVLLITPNILPDGN